MISAILLAAGKSKRMNGENKLTKKFKGIPLIKYAVQNILSSAIEEVIIILGYQSEIVEKIIDKNNKIKFILNENFESGMASSIKIGINNLSDQTESFFICLGDMPNVNRNIYDKLIQSKNNKEIVVPNFKGNQCNPILFSRSVINTLMNVQGDTGAKKILELNKNKILNVNIDELNFAKDFDTPEDFKT